MNNLYSFRVLLIKLGKILPFVVCTIVLLSYTEAFVCLIEEDYTIYSDSLVLNQSISWHLGFVFEYNLQFLFLMFILSIAIDTCVWNKLTCLYLAFNLLEKFWLTNHIYDEKAYVTICLFNIAIAFCLVCKGIKNLVK